MRTIIVGAGATGCVLANRLSARADEHVILIEAGPDYDPRDLPDDLADGRQNALFSHDWGLKHRPNSKQVRFPFPRGRVVGGSSQVNTCIAVRGQPEDYAEWAARGLPEWSWEHVLPAFKRLENDIDFGDRPEHGDSGPMPIRRHPRSEWTTWAAAFVDACLELGYPACDDTNTPGAEGVGAHAMNKLGDRRVSAAEGYLTSAVRERENFTLRAETETLRVLFEGRRAVGVEVAGDSGPERINADRVLLAAGSTWTPVLLYRSGVGPRDRLDALGVEVVADNRAVGTRLLDHPGCAMFFLPRPGVVRTDDPVIQTVCRFSSGTTDVPGDILMQPGSKVPTSWGTLPGCSIMLSVGKPKGHGLLEIHTVKPGKRPKLHSRLLDHPDDRAVAVAAMGRAAEIAAQPAMRDLARHIYPLQGTARDAKKRDRWIRKATDSGYHPCGTVPMGGPEDLDAACDGDGRVRGVENLHVVDASLMPTIPSPNIHIPCLMLAERLAEML